VLPQNPSGNLNGVEMRETALMKAVNAGDVARCRSLIKNRADVNAGDEWRPIHLACQNGNLPIARMLVEAGATLTGGPTEPFALAAVHRAVEVCQLLVDAGVDPHQKNEHGFTAFTHACSAGNRTTVEYLLKQGADVNFATPDGETVLMRAAGFNRLAVVKLLVEAGADTVLPRPSRDSPKLTPFQKAVKSDAVGVMEYFLTELGEDPAQRTVDGKTLRQLARDDGKAQQLLASVRTAQLISDSAGAAGAVEASPVLSRGMALAAL
jgi:ankyrin repeat protein